MLRRAWAGILLLGSLQSASVGAQETSSQPGTADRQAVVLEVGEPPERAIRGEDDLPPGDRKVEAALERIVTLRCHEVPFGVLAQEIERQLDIPVLLFNDRWARSWGESDPNRKVSIDVDSVPLAIALEELRSPDRLTLSTADGKLTLIPAGEGDEDRTTRIYPVSRLQEIGIPRLIKIIETVTTGPWDDDEPGTGTISSYGNALVVRQTYQNHRQIELLLHLMIQAYVKPKHDEIISNHSAKPADGKASPVESPRRPAAAAATSPERPAIELTVSEAPLVPLRGVGDLTPGDWVVETALRRIVTLRCQSVSIEDLAREIERKLHIPVRFDLISLHDSGVDPRETVSIDARGVPLYQAISYIGSSPSQIVVVGGKVLFVGGNGCDFANITRIYPVARFQTLGFNRLSDLIVQETSGPWDEDEPGTGTITSFGDTFVIRQTATVHREIESLLNVVERLDIQPLPGEQVWKNAAAVIATEGRATARPSQTDPTPSRAEVDGRTSLGNLAFRSSKRDLNVPDDSSRRDDAATDRPSSTAMRFDVSALPQRPMRGTGDLTPEEAKVENALRRIVTLQCENLPLEQFAREIERALDIPVRIQVGRPPDFAVNPRERISIEVYGVPLGQAFSLGPAVGWIADGGELRFVHSECEDDERRRTRVYSVAQYRVHGLDRLSELIKDQTSGPWHDDEPGTGTLEVTRETFVIHQTSKVHREIENLLDVFDRMDIRAVPYGQQLEKPVWQGGGWGGGFFGTGESPFQKE